MEENKPPLTVIDGGKVSPEREGKQRSGNRTESGLTAKQEKFAALLAEGASNSDAYRGAYDCSRMKPGSIHTEASKLALSPAVTQRVNELLGQKRQRISMFTEKQSDRVWRNVWRLAEGHDVPPSVQQAALSLAAKMAGMLTDKVEIKNENVDSKSLEAELLERLQRLTG